MAVKRLVIVADTQSPFEDPQCVALAAAFIKDYKPDTVVMNGDMVDLCTASKFVRSKSGPQTVKEEIEWAIGAVIEPIRNAAPKADYYWVEGNHEFRLNRYIRVMAPVLEGLIEAVPLFQCERLKIKYVGSKAGNGILKLTPHLTIMHGTAHGVNPAKKQYDSWGGSLVMGHTHKESTYRRKAGCGSDHVALSSGCLCKDPDWNDIENYTRGFIAGWYDDESGEFGLDHVRIVCADFADEGSTRKILSPWGSYYAKRVNDKWIGASLSKTSRRRVSDKG
jgi:predicted phosphodiesterase